MAANKMKQRFCRKVSEIRLCENISLEELVQRSGVPLEMLEKVEQNIIPAEMMVEDAVDLARVFGCEPYELFQ